MRRDKLRRYGFPIMTFFLGMFFSPFSFSLQDSGTATNQKIKVLDHLDLLIMIVSAPGNIKQRTAVRQTWLSSHHSEIRGFFVIGVKDLSAQVQQSLDEEKNEFEDMVFINMVDSYTALSEKVLSMMSYAEEHFTSNLLMKCDDDTFINIYMLAKEIKKRTYQDDMLYWGYFDGRAPVFKKGKWAENDYNLCDRYIPYALGGGYILGWEIVKHLSRSSHILKEFRNEDVSLGTWLAGVDVHRIHDERFDTEWKSRGCVNNYLVSHSISPDDMVKLWSRISSGQSLCSKEVITRPSYSYNWDLPPSQCCVR